MKRSLILRTVALTILIAALETKAQDRHARMRAGGYEALISAAAERHGVDARLLWAIAYQETRFRPGLVSPKGARGLMQFMPATGARYGLVNPHDPAQSVDAAARYVRDLAKRFNGNMRLVLAAYNSGEGTVEAYLTGRKLILPTGKVINALGMKTGGVPPYRETRDYVSGVTAIYKNISSAGMFTPRAARHPGVPAALSKHLEAAEREEPERSLYVTVVATTSQPTIRTNEAPTGPPTETPSDPSPSARSDSSGSPGTRSIYIP
ncbi:MAG: lytic transglycosylase domain-containing protein [Acidobacteriota bacterium]|nr:lytic transglycosylase domain-containing protein [Acidobacteriota bacterium]